MQSADGEGPAWNKFWMSLDNETESMMSGEGSHRPTGTPDARSLMSPDGRPGMHDRGDSVLPNDSASHHGADTPDHSAVAGATSPHLENTLFPFKFKAPSGRIHRLQIIASAGIDELVSQVGQKSGFALSYLDNEGDTVSITTDRDLLDAVVLAQQGHREKVDLFVHDPEKPPLAATLDPQPALAKPQTPPAPVVRERKRYESEEDEDEEFEKPRRARTQPAKQQEELIAGVPNELLLPGAIVTLAVVIVGVFALSRASSR
jgi:hypothetical protein